MDNITEILSSYINARDNAKGNAGGIVGVSKMNQMTQFSMMVNSFSAELADELPRMNLAQLEAFAELANSRLNYVRMNMHK